MTNDDTFLRAIWAAPTDPTPRLAYADWLDERADPRGTYLRLADRREQRALRPGIPADWLRSLGDFSTGPDEETPHGRVPAVAALLKRPPAALDAQGYRVSIDAASPHPLGDGLAWLECRQKDTGSYTDITFTLRMRVGERATEWTPETYNPYFGCRTQFLEWFGDTLLFIYEEKHRVYAARLRVGESATFVAVESDWRLDGGQLGHLKWRGTQVERVAVPSLEPLPPLSLAEAGQWGLRPTPAD